MRALTAALLGAAALHAAAATPDDAAMHKLAADSGCTTCHGLDPSGAGAQGLAPIGPAWRAVAARYKGRKDAAEQLTRTVLAGSSPYDSHWKGKVAGLAMPSNAVVLKEPQARRLVAWILALPPAKP
jgi:cytochrome c